MHQNIVERFIMKFLKYVGLPWRFKMYILQRHKGLCMHNFLTKKYDEMCDLYRQGDFLIRQ